MPRAYGLPPLQVGIGSPNHFCQIQHDKQNHSLSKARALGRDVQLHQLCLWLFHAHIKQLFDSANWILCPASASLSCPSLFPFPEHRLLFQFLRKRLGHSNEVNMLGSPLPCRPNSSAVLRPTSHLCVLPVPPPDRCTFPCALEISLLGPHHRNVSSRAEDC